MTVVDRRDYFMNLLTFKCLNDKAPDYLSDLIHRKSDFLMHTRETRYNEADMLYVPIPTKTIYEKSFQYQGPCLFNSLPLHVQSASSTHVFKKEYKKDYKCRYLSVQE